MKILFCFWSQYNDKLRRGGGIRVYLENVINHLKNNGDFEIYTLSSGTKYTINNRCSIKRICVDNDNIYQYEAINSPVVAPGYSAMDQKYVYLNSDILLEQMIKFINDVGKFDVIHFQGLEGFSLRCLELKKFFPNTKIILSIHNYHVFCPQVNLWKNGSERCVDNNNEIDCENCLPIYASSKDAKIKFMIQSFLPTSFADKALPTIKKIYSQIHKNKQNKQVSDHDTFDYRKKSVHVINTYVDYVLAVSKRVEDIVIGFGLDKKKVIKDYIGVNTNKFTIEKKKKNIDSLTIAYIGYMFKEKGFYFILDSLEKLSIEKSRDINLVFACRFTDPKAVDRLKKLKLRYKSVKIHDGYTHDNISDILENVDLGIVPVLWEDNLPQVAIEFNLLGIAVLASCLGGASELSTSSAFIFNPDNNYEFENKLLDIVNNPKLINNYWKYAKKITTMDEHIESLISIYKKKV